MPPGDCEILRPFCCPADGAAMGAAAPGRDMGKESKEGAAGRGRAGRRASALPAFGGFGTPSMRVPRGLAAISAHFGRACRPSLSGRACRPAPCPPPACVVSVLFVCWAACPGAAAPMAARGSLICVRSGFCSQIRDSQRFVTIFNTQLTGF